MGKDDDMFQQTKKSIIGNCFSIVEEYKLWELLGQRIKEGRKCLASAIVDKVDENDEVIKSYEKYKELYLFILKKCFWETEAGTMKLIRNNCNKNEDFLKNCIGIKPAYNWPGKATGCKVYAAFAISSG